MTDGGSTAVHFGLSVNCRGGSHVVQWPQAGMRSSPASAGSLAAWRAQLVRCRAIFRPGLQATPPAMECWSVRRLPLVLLPVRSGFVLPCCETAGCKIQILKDYKHQPDSGRSFAFDSTCVLCSPTYCCAELPPSIARHTATSHTSMFPQSREIGTTACPCRRNRPHGCLQCRHRHGRAAAEAGL